MKRGNLAALLHVLSFLIVLGVSMLAEPHLSIPKSVAKPLGLLTFLTGMAVFIWALAHLKGAFFGDIEPVTDRLVNSGPYRFVRHPLYLGMVVSTLGLVLGLRSLWGLVGVFLLFVPAVAYRASLEEKALARTLGREWEDYAAQTSFLFPPLW
ncbi:MAG: methyltransferase family protein [Anaerolineae bacterium]